MTFVLRANDPARKRVLENACEFLRKLSPAKSWRVEVSEHKERRSDAQNRYLWGDEMNWQPIETAPKDGTNVLLYREAGNMFIVGYFDNAHGWVDGECIATVAGPDYWCKLEPPK